MLDQMKSGLQTERDALTKETRLVHAVVIEVLNADDRALSRLNEVDLSSANNNPPSKPSTDLDAIQHRVTQLVEALRHFRVQAVKDGLDQTYLECLGDDAQTTEAGPADADADATAKELRQDLNSLYAEIDDVVTMVVSREYGEIESALQEGRRIGQQKDHAIQEQVRKLFL
jgi:hypothetical protein